MTGYGPRGDKPRRAGSSIPEIIAVYDVTSGSGSISIPETCDALLYLWGAGASGGGVGAGGINAGGGGGGAALFKRLLLRQGQVLAYSVGAAGVGSSSDGNDGADTTVTVGSSTYVARGGKKGLANATGGLGGEAFGGDINRRGGKGGNGDSPSGFAGEAGEFGGEGGAADGQRGGGGGAAGFSDLLGLVLRGGAGSNGNNTTNTTAGAAPGGGSGGAGGTSGPGGAGRLYLVLVAR